ncbi:glyoxylase-like metal-dependent hydrolase (beta-lactamase superfamily II) [Stackebrandtia albiflava]|uniref:Glyoxylase-like metal-dependent hydrolase (Beta-lactamase superfamily II) n=1 Tax=Stackebrandtia albiflava TaxID=406432 RepID=A0A562VCQ0_9ACTN|nr:MBL fold metallo-hydrolase [Stackebrandtia albiflava]TWJ15673.1 glyoxylase-like metal-dependent hydrolase (beta-lactamase superfamily II) [Stackebrandtia albiflava]
MLIRSLVAEAFATNCYVVAPEAGAECVVVDPGIGVVPGLDEVLAEHRLKPVAVLMTHGHLDHTFSVTPVCGARDIPAYIHAGDRELLADPMKGLSPQLGAIFGGRLTWTEPDDVAILPDGGDLRLAGLEFTVDHAPGHTPGSVLFRLPGDDDAAAYCLSGDVLFAGSIGRTDLPGGSTEAMMTSLRDKILPLADETEVLPGHGGATTIGRERRTNPFLRQVNESGHMRAPTRGM